MRFSYLATILAVSMAVLAPADVSAQAPLMTRRTFDPEVDHFPPLRRTTVNEAVSSLMSQRVIGARRTAPPARPVLTREESSAINREIAQMNKEIKTAKREQDRQTTLAYPDRVKLAEEIDDARNARSMEHYPQTLKDAKIAYRKTLNQDIPAAEEKVRVATDRVKQFEARLKDVLKPEVVIPQGSGFSALRQVKFMPLDKARTTNLDQKIKMKNANWPQSLADSRKFDVENLKLLNQVSTTNVPEYVLVRDLFTGVTLPMPETTYRALQSSPEKFHNTLNPPYPLSSGQRYEMTAANAGTYRIPQKDLGKWVEDAARRIQQNEADRFKARLSDAEAVQKSSEAKLTQLTTLRDQQAKAVENIDAQWTKPEMKEPPKNPLNPLNPLQEAELASSDEFMENPVQYFRKRRSVVVNVDIDA